MVETHHAPPRSDFRSAAARFFNSALALAHTRAEPLVQLARWHRARLEWPLALMFARLAVATPRPPDQLFVEDAVYAWRALDELSIAAWHAGARDEGKRAAERLVAEKRFPPSERERIEKNLTWYR